MKNVPDENVDTSLFSSIASHVSWVDSMWFSGNSPTTQGLNHARLRDLAIASLGLCGECSEVFDEVSSLDQPQSPSHALVSELGDVSYYWFRLSSILGLDPQALLATAVKSSSSLYPSPSLTVVPTDHATELLLTSSRFAEIAKKHIRDGSDSLDRAASAMLAVAVAWLRVLDHFDIDPKVVWAANHEKITGRLSRNTLRGSGNNR